LVGAVGTSKGIVNRGHIILLVFLAVSADAMLSFREQTQVLNSWFSQWNRSEQTISLYALLTRVSAEQASFLMLVLEHNLKARSESDKQDLDGVTKQANSSGTPSCLCTFRPFTLKRVKVEGNGFIRDLLFALVCVG
jgi:hypothetical protein